VNVPGPTGGDYLCFDAPGMMWINDRTPRSFVGPTGVTGPFGDVTDPKEGDKWCSSIDGTCYIYQNGMWNLLPCPVNVMSGSSGDTVIVDYCGTEMQDLVAPPSEDGCYVWCQDGATGMWQERRIRVKVCDQIYDFTGATGTIELDIRPLVIGYTGGVLPGPTGATEIGQLPNIPSDYLPNPIYAQDPQTCLTHVFICGEGWQPIGENCPPVCDFVSFGKSGPLTEIDDGIVVSITSSSPSSGTVSHILQSISIGGTTYPDLIAPDTFTSSFTNIATTAVTVQFNGPTIPTNTVGDYVTDFSDYLDEALRAFQSRNLNHYHQVNLSLAPAGSTGMYQLGYDSPVPSNSGIFIIITERGGNNDYTIEAFDSNDNSLGTLTVNMNGGGLPDDYTNSGFANSGSQNIFYAIYPIEDLATLGSQISSLKVTFPLDTDGPDGKIFFWGESCNIG
jgi:hypothetical protein